MPGLITPQFEPHGKCAYLPKLEWSKLQRKDPVEVEKLLSACQTYGFFYLNLVTPESDQVVRDWKGVLEFMDMYFDQPLEKKMLDDRKSDTYG